VTSPRRRFAARRKEQTQTGSPIIGEPVFIVVGILRRPHGLRGEVLVSLETDFPERLIKGASLLLGDDHIPVTIASQRQHSQGLLLSFEELPDKEAVEAFRNVPLFVRAAELPELKPGEFYQHQLLGLKVVEEGGEELGTLAQVLDTGGANDVYLVRTNDDKELLLPAIRSVIREVDLAGGRMIVHLLPGLRDLA
jgi:16S rRNA processing protein RimM